MHKNPSITQNQYNALKRNLIEMEKTNFGEVIIIPCSGNGGWHELAERSVLFYYYGACQKLHTKNHFYADEMSFYDQYQVGYMRTSDPEHIIRNLKRVNLYQSHEKRSHFIIIKLNRTYSAEEIKAMAEKERLRRLGDLTANVAVNLDPELHQTLASLGIRLHNLCNSRLDGLSRITRGAEVVKLIDEILFDYHVITMAKRSRQEIIEKFVKMRKQIYRLIVIVNVFGDTKRLDLDVCISIMDSLTSAKKQIEADIKKLNKTPEA